jgi:hypothetical protein
MIFKPKSFYNIGSSLVIYDITFMRYLRTKLLFLLMFLLILDINLIEYIL